MLHATIWFGWNAGVGVHVRTVPAGFHALEVTGKVDGGVTNRTSVKSVFIGSLKVNTTGAEGETPVALFAGTLETRVGSALNSQNQPKEIVRRKTLKAIG
jgi:hypothetical protein